MVASRRLLRRSRLRFRVLGLDSHEDLRHPCTAVHSCAERLILLRTVDAAEPDAFGVLVVQDFDGVAVEDGDDMIREVGGESRDRP